MPEACNTLDLAPIGNCTATALVDRLGRFIWACYPRVDGEPVFSALLQPSAPPAGEAGLWSIELEGQVAADQAYVRNTAVLRTVLRDGNGAELEIIDFAPRLFHLGRTYRPWAFFRRLSPLKGAPRVRIRVNPTGNRAGMRPLRPRDQTMSAIDAAHRPFG